MDPRSQSDSDGGGGRRGWSPPPPPSPPAAGSPGTPPRDEGRLQTADPGPADGELRPHAPSVLSLDQIRITGSSNEYTDGPTVAQRSPASQQKNAALTSSVSGQQETREERPNNLRNLHSLAPRGDADASISSAEGNPSSFGAGDFRGSVRSSVDSAASGQRLLAGDQIIRTQPKRSESDSEELKPLNDEPRALEAVPGTGGGGGTKDAGAHSNRCGRCGRCRCRECVRPRALPFCWMCSRRCMCSAQTAVEYGTCVCCVKGLFYHCSSDDEDTCTDKPFSCTQSHCCVRWATVSLLSLLFPCLLCYLPAKGCTAACQSCYDRAARPGCRCKNTNPIHCEAVGKPT